MVLIKGLRLKIKGSCILEDISLELKRQRLHYLVGESGSGKTSLLKCLAHLHTKYEGEICIGNRQLPSLSPLERVQQIGYLAQGYNLFPDKRALENCVAPQLQVLKRERSESEELANSYFQRLGIDGLQNRLPHELSGGQQQRVALVRALCMGSTLLLLDEPTAALDPGSRQHFGELIDQLLQEGVTLVIATHDMDLVRQRSGEIHTMEKGRLSTPKLDLTETRPN